MERKSDKSSIIIYSIGLSLVLSFFQRLGRVAVSYVKLCSVFYVLNPFDPKPVTDSDTVCERFHAEGTTYISGMTSTHIITFIDQCGSLINTHAHACTHTHTHTVSDE